MRGPRRRQPDQLLDITIRCQRSEFRFLPTKERTELLGYWFARAQEKFPGIVILAICAMSSHVHICLRDRRAEASNFMQFAVGHAAKAINKLDGVRGSVLERRFTEIVILDEASLVKRIAYAINNPVEANLVRSHGEWAGLCLFAGGEATVHRFTIFHEKKYQKALRAARRTGVEVHAIDFQETAELEIGALDAGLAKEVACEVDRRGKELRAKQTSVMGMRRVLSLSPFDRPEKPKRSPRPLCFASSWEARQTFISGWRAFVAEFRAASREFRSGALNVRFPMFSFRPSTATT